MIRIIRDKPSPGKGVRETVEDMERATAALAVEKVTESWPSKTGESLPVLDDNNMEFRAPYARYVRRSGGSGPLLETEVPRLAAEAADETFNHFADALSEAIFREIR